MFNLGNRTLTGRKHRSHSDHRRSRDLRAAQKTRLRFEPLEDRRLLSIYTVTNLSDGPVEDSGDLPGSLRQAIYNANNHDGKDTIQFASGLSGTITLTEDELEIEGGLTIDGPGSSVLTIDGDDLSGIFYIDNGDEYTNVNVEINGLTLQHGYTMGDGGAIYSIENLSLDDVIITGNEAEGDGGGVYVAYAYGLSVEISNSTISGNTAGGDGGGVWFDAYDHADMTIQDSTISGNISGGNGGGVMFYGFDHADMTIQDSTISGNTADGNGGGIYSYLSESCDVLIENSDISSENAAGGNGGGLWANTDVNSTMTLKNSIVSDNEADGNGGGVYSYTYGNSNTLIQDSTISGNEAYDGGGLWTYVGEYSYAAVRQSTVSGNTAESFGGGLYVKNYGPTVIQNSTITGNTAIEDGGGIYAYYEEYTSLPIVQSTIVAANDSTSGAPDLNGSSFILRNCLIGDNTGSGLAEAPVGSPDVSGNLIGDPTGDGIIDPMLGPLTNNGGFTQTHALLSAASPAYNMGDNPAGLTYDQRGAGYPRVYDSVADIGAYELQETTTQPEITVLLNTIDIVSGETVIDFGSVLHGNAEIAKTFTIRNDGDQTLLLTTPFENTAHFTVGQPGTASLLPGASTTFTVTLSTDAVWSGAESILIYSNDADGGDGVENPFTLLVSGVVEAIPPEITVLIDSTEIANGQTAPIDFGAAALGDSGPSRTFTIRNDGDETLTLSSSSFVDTDHFTVGQPGSLSLAPGETTTFTVTLKTDELWEGAEWISFTNNDADNGDGVESPFTFAVSGRVAILGPEIAVFDDATEIANGETTPIDLGSAVHYATGPAKTFTIRNDGAETLTLTAASFVDTAHFTITPPATLSVAPGESATFTVTLKTDEIWSGSEQIALYNNDQDNGDGVENPFTFYVSGTVTVMPPEITVLVDSTEIANGQTAPIYIGIAALGDSGPVQTFTIRNDGDETLTLSSSSFVDTDHFTVGQPGALSLDTGETTTFTVTLKTDELWEGAEWISFTNNDADNGDGVESPFTFAVSGQVAILGPEIAVFDDATEIANGETTPIDLGSAVHYATGPAKTFTIRNDGAETLTLTAASFVDTAHFTITPPATLSVAPGESATFTVTLKTDEIWSGSEQIALYNNDQDNGDGVENPFTFYVSGTVTAMPPEITVLVDSTEIANGQTTPIYIGAAALGDSGPVQTFTIRNDGDETLTLSSASFVDTDHFTVSEPASLSLAPGETTTFTVTLKTHETWSGTEWISFANNDADNGDGVENPFSFPVLGSVAIVGPEIVVLDGTTPLVNGETTPIDVGSAAHNETGPQKTFTIRNEGSETLVLMPTSFYDTDHFTVTGPPTLSLAPGESTSFTVTLQTDLIWSGTESIIIYNNDADNGDGVENPFTFYISGTVTAMPPEITVLIDLTEISNGQTAPIDFGAAALGDSGPSRTFTIRNDGDETLTLSSSSFVDTDHFTVGQPGSLSLAPGETTTFTVTLKTDELWEGAEWISFTNNDADNGDGVESPFTFAVSGRVAILGPEIAVFDDATEIANGETTPIDLGSAVHYATGPAKTFTIRNDGTETLTLTAASFGDTAHFTITPPSTLSVAPGESTTFTVALKTDEVWSGSEQIALYNNDQDNGDGVENPFTLHVSGTVAAIPPEITVLVDSTEIANGQTTPIDFGSVAIDASGAVQTFTIRNDGDETLTLSSASFVDTGHFTVSQPGALSLAAGESTTFTVALKTDELWEGVEWISFVNNDADNGDGVENPFTFAVSGRVAVLGPEIAVYDGATELTDGETTPIDLGVAVYDTTGPAKTFTIRNMGTETLTLASDSFVDTDHFTVSLPGALSLAPGETTTFTVTLKTDAIWSGAEQIAIVNNDQDNGDGVENPFTFYVSGAVAWSGPEITVLDGETVLTSAKSTKIELGSATLGASGPSKTFTIRNDGNETLTLDPDSFVDTAHCTVSLPGSTTLAPGESTTFTVTLMTNAVWSGANLITIASNDGNGDGSVENPFKFRVTGTVEKAGPEITIYYEGIEITSGQLEALFVGSAVRGSEGVSITLTIHNDGDQMLKLSKPFADTAHFEVSRPDRWDPANGPGRWKIPPGTTRTFTITLKTDEVWSGTELISLFSNDADGGDGVESPFTFYVSGEVTAMPPEVTVLDGEKEITSGATKMYDVGEANRDETGPVKTFTIRNDGDQTLTLDAASFVDTDHFTVSQPGSLSLAPGESTTFTVTLMTGEVWSGAEQISFTCNDADNGDGVESPFSFYVSGKVTKMPPEITVLYEGAVIACGETTPIDAGSAVRTTVARSITLTICNDGDRTLKLSKPFDDTDHFTVGDPEKSTLKAGESTTFTITLKTGEVWSGAEEITFLSTDADNGDGVESPFTLTVSGSVTAPLNDLTTIGGYDPKEAVFHLRNTNDSGQSNIEVYYGRPKNDWIPITGDFNGDGVETIGLYNPTTSVFYLRNSNTSGYADITFAYGLAGSGWTPITGDWDGDGVDTVGLYNSVTSTFMLRNSNTRGYANITLRYGQSNCGWTPLVGDWDGDGVDTIGLYNPTTSQFYLRNVNSSGYAQNVFYYGSANKGWDPVVGDWDGDGVDTIGLYNAKNGQFHLRYTNDRGVADATFDYTPAKKRWAPVTGVWTIGNALLADAQATDSTNLAVLTQDELEPIVAEAIARWSEAGLDAMTLAGLSEVQFVIADLPDNYLGKAKDGLVWIDGDAAGLGWFVDPTPAQDEEFETAASGSLQAIDPAAVDHIDLLSVVMHELGHIAGLDDLDALAESVMSGVLGVGVRRDID